ncbi:MAG: DUF6788 family protein [Elusimicrobiota bacterium]|nr:DUF6788 family protein [Elusimicrobiota bacterium]
MSTIKQRSASERAALSRLRQIMTESCFLRGSLIELKHPCGKSNCKCSRGKSHWHTSWYLSQSRDGKLRRKSIPKNLLPQVRQWVNRYREAKKLLDKVSQQYWKHLEQKRKA